MEIMAYTYIYIFNFSTSSEICYYTALWNLNITIVADFRGILHSSHEEFILQDMRPINSTDFNSNDCKVYQLIQQQLDDLWYQQTEAVAVEL